MKFQEKNSILFECRQILSEHFIDTSQFTFSIEKEEYTYFVYAKRKGKVYFEISDIYVDDDYKIIQYGVNWK